MRSGSRAQLAKPESVSILRKRSAYTALCARTPPLSNRALAWESLLTSYPLARLLCLSEKRRRELAARVCTRELDIAHHICHPPLRGDFSRLVECVGTDSESRLGMLIDRKLPTSRALDRS